MSWSSCTSPSTYTDKRKNRKKPIIPCRFFNIGVFGDHNHLSKTGFKTMRRMHQDTLISSENGSKNFYFYHQMWPCKSNYCVGHLIFKCEDLWSFIVCVNVRHLTWNTHENSAEFVYNPNLSFHLFWKLKVFFFIFQTVLFLTCPSAAHNHLIWLCVLMLSFHFYQCFVLSSLPVCFKSDYSHKSHLFLNILMPLPVHLKPFPFVSCARLSFWSSQFNPCPVCLDCNILNFYQ